MHKISSIYTYTNTNYFYNYHHSYNFLSSQIIIIPFFIPITLQSNFQKYIVQNIIILNLLFQMFNVSKGLLNCHKNPAKLYDSNDLKQKAIKNCYDQQNSSRIRTSYIGLYNHRENMSQQFKMTTKSQREQQYNRNQNKVGIFQTDIKKIKQFTIQSSFTKKHKNLKASFQLMNKTTDSVASNSNNSIVLELEGQNSRVDKIYNFPFFYDDKTSAMIKTKVIPIRKFSLQKNKSSIQERHNKSTKPTIFGLQVKKYYLLQKIDTNQTNKKIKTHITPRYISKQIKKKIVKKNPINISNSNTNTKVLMPRDSFQEKVTKYRQFIFKIYFSNSAYFDLMPITEKNNKKKQIKYIAYVGPGNNSNLIKSLLKRRWWWTISYQINQQIQFLWTQLKQKYYLLNQKKNQKYICNIELLKADKKKLKQEVNEKLMHRNDQIIYQNYLHSTFQKQPIEFQTRFKFINKNPIRKLSQYQKVHNHFQYNQFIGNKKALLRNFLNYYQYKKISLENYNIPRTFHIQGPRDVQLGKFMDLYKKKQEANHPNIWIIKPGENSNRGRGIKVCRTIQDILKILKQKNHTHIVQQYVCDLMLYYKRKFDIRTYVLITQVNGIIKAYWYQDGYIRTSSQLYQLDDLNDEMIHLTNDAIQKYGENYGRFQPGNKISYQQLQKYLDQQFGQAKYQMYKLKNQMKKIATQAVLASYPLIDPNNRENNFQIFGLDYLVDKNFRPWLLEVNTNPCLEASSQLLTRLIPRMVENAFKIGLDPLFPPTDCPYNAKPYIPDNFLETNKFELIFDFQYDRILDYQKLYEINNREKYQQEMDTYSNEGNQINNDFD